MRSGFESLREALLRAGVAPRHVRRYLTELCEHLADLTARERAAGHDARDAAIRARAALGDDEILSRAMLAKPGVHSFSSRAPWAVFGLAPLMAVAAGFALAATLLSALARSHGGIIAHAIPALAGFVTTASNYGLGPLIAILFVILALRQRMGLAWPLAGIFLIAIAASFLNVVACSPATGSCGGAASAIFVFFQYYPFTILMIVFRLLLTLLPAAALYLVLRKRFAVSSLPI